MNTIDPSRKLHLINQELIFQNNEKEKRAAELMIANKELIYQNTEKEKRAAELIVANLELDFQNNEKEKRAAELVIANQELIFQNNEKEKRAAELSLVNQELISQNKEKEKLTADLIRANLELDFQNNEKEKRASELIIANLELVFQNKEKEQRASELAIANKELAFQNEEKVKRAAELIIANRKLIVANNELIAFTYISSHDLQEPLRKIQTFISVILEKEVDNLTEKGKFNFKRIQASAARMQKLISDLLDFSRINSIDREFEPIDIHLLIDDIKDDLSDIIHKKNATIEVFGHEEINAISFQFRQLFYHLLDNALKFSNPDVESHIIIESKIVRGDKINHDRIIPKKEYCHISIQDNGIGFESEFAKRIFEVFQKLHNKEENSGTGIGLAIVRKIVDNHNGIITATSELGQGAKFDIYIPVIH